MDWPKLCTTRLVDQNFGMCISPQDIMVPFFNNQGSIYYRPWKICEEVAQKEIGSAVENSKDKFQLMLDVQHFLPNEVSVKVNDKEIVIEGKHEERKDDHGFISRQFMRRYALPKECPAETITSTLSSDGVLTVIANKTITKDIESAKTVPIKLEGACRKTEQIESKKIAAEELKVEKCETKMEKCEMKNQNTNEMCEIKNKNEMCEVENQNKNEMSEIKNQNKNATCETKKGAETEKPQTQVMLMEEHSRLLKSGLLNEAVTESEKLITESKKDTEKLLSESRKETDELLKLISADKTLLSGTEEKLEEALGQCKTAIKDLKKEKIAEASMSAEMSSTMSSMMSETIEMSMSSSSTSKATTSTSEKICDIVSDIITAELREAAENI